VIPTETGPFPTTIFPTETASWVRDWVDKPKASQVDDSGRPKPVVPCWAWFVWSCPPDVGGIVLNGFSEPGIYPEYVVLPRIPSFLVLTFLCRGGPPDVGPNPPPGLTLKIPWPQIT
jgi:hypothetical protein